MYCTTAEVYSASQLDSTVVSEADVNGFILAAEQEVDLLTFTTYWVLNDSGTASDGTASTLEDTSKSWTIDEYSNFYVYIYSGTGSGQVRQISSNTSDTLTILSGFTTIPDNTSLYRIVYTATTPLVGTERLDGTGTDTFFVPQIPIVDIESLTIYKNFDTATSVTLSSMYKYSRTGKLVLSKDSEVSIFYKTYPQAIDLQYSYGVYTIPQMVKRYCIIAAAERMLSAQMGSTYNVPSTYSLPEGSVTIGQAYINIDSTAKRLSSEKQDLAKILPKYSIMN